MMSNGGRPPRFAALQSRNFRLVWISLIVSNAGTQMQNAGQLWLVHDMTDAPIYLGLLSASFAIPMLFVTPWGGALVDRLPRVRLLQVTRGGMVGLSIVLAALTWGGWLELWQMLLLSFLFGCLLAIDNPGRQALLPDLVPPTHLISATSLNSTSFTGAALFGPALGGVLLGRIGAAGVFLVTAVSYVVILVAMFRLHDVPELSAARRRTGAGLMAGLRYARQDGVIVRLIALVALTSLLGRSYQTLMPVFARDVLGTGPEGYGLLLAAPGAGALVAGFGLAAYGEIRRPKSALFGTLLGFGGTLALFALSPGVVMALGMLFLVGVLQTALVAIGTTELQLRTAAELRGRVMALNTSALIGLSSLGGLGAGALATVTGAPQAVLVGVLAMVLLGAGVIATMPGLAPAADPTPRTESGEPRPEAPPTAR